MMQAIALYSAYVKELDTDDFFLEPHEIKGPWKTAYSVVDEELWSRKAVHRYASTSENFLARLTVNQWSVLWRT